MQGLLGETDIRGCSGGVSDGTEGWFIGNWRKGDPCGNELS